MLKSACLANIDVTNQRSRNYLKGRDGDCINAVLAAAGYNFTLLIKWFEALFFARLNHGRPQSKLRASDHVKIRQRRFFTDD